MIVEGVRCERGGVRREAPHWGDLVQITCIFGFSEFYLNLSKLFVAIFGNYLSEVINGEWREARQMRDIPVAFSYFKVILTPNSS